MSHWRRALVAVCVIGALASATGCELILRFDRDQIRDASVRSDGDVVGGDAEADD